MPPTRELRPASVSLLLYAVTLLVGPLVRASVMPTLRPWVVLAALVPGALLGGLLGERRWLLRGIVVLGVGVVVALSEGALLGAWCGLSLAVADWGVRRWRPVPLGHRPAGRAAIVVALIAVVAAWRGADTAAGVTAVVVMAVAGLVLAIGLLAGAALDRWIDSVVGVSTRALGVVVFSMLAIPVVVVPWLIRRLARMDELDAPHRPGSAWARRATRSVRPEHPWSAEVLVDRPAWAPRARVVALWLVIGVVVGAMLWPRVTEPTPLAAADGASWWEEPSSTPPAYAGAAWYPEYREDIEWVMNQDAAFRPLHPVRVADVATRHVNVVGGVRTTWSPPCRDCDRLLVWVYGGSTIFGIGQRDEHTIPSELARAAWDDGIALEVVNRGTPGDLLWDEVQRAAWDLAVGPPPDLVVFYDGANELWAARTMNDRGVPDGSGPFDPLLEQFWDGVLDARGGDVPDAPPDGRLVPTSTVAPREPSEIGELAARRYGLARRASEATVGSIPTHWFWQPTTASRPEVDGEPQHGDGGRNARATSDAARRGLPDVVVDLSDVLDGLTEPLFSDDVHHNEVAARVIAGAIFDTIRSDLQRLQVGR